MVVQAINCNKVSFSNYAPLVSQNCVFHCLCSGSPVCRFQNLYPVGFKPQTRMFKSAKLYVETLNAPLF